MTEILYCQSPALFLLAVVLLICFLLRLQAHRVRAALDLILCILLLIGGVVLYYLGMYDDCFTIHDFWQIRPSGWVGLGVVAAGSVWHLCKVCKRGVERRRTERAARQTEEAHRQALESARREAYEAGKAAVLLPERVGSSKRFADMLFCDRQLKFIIPDDVKNDRSLPFWSDDRYISALQAEE